MRAFAPLALAAIACSPKPPAPAPVQATVAPPVVAPAPAAAPATPAKDYPETRRENVVDRLHGTDVKDPYRWLEDPSKPDVEAWMTAQDSYARTRLEKLEGRDAITKVLTDVMYYDSVSAPIHRNGRYFYTR